MSSDIVVEMFAMVMYKRYRGVLHGRYENLFPPWERLEDESRQAWRKTAIEFLEDLSAGELEVCLQS